MIRSAPPRESSYAMTHRHQRGSRSDGPVDRNTRILVIEHDRRISTALTFMLSARGYDEVRAVRSAARAIAIAEAFCPGIVFLDIERPDSESLDLAAQLYRRVSRSALRLIALTNSIGHELREEARLAGFERYLVKPLSQVELDKVLRLPREVA
jgi:DNA-binding response OmpR family regulator